MNARPGRLVVVAGTGTEIGKTWVGCRLAKALREAGRTVAARKPAQSFESGERTDADHLSDATGEDPSTICPRHRWYAVPMAPFMAADVLGRGALTLADLAGELAWPAEPVDVGLLEPAGGVRSPMTHDGADTVDLARAVAADFVILVADAGLGTINAVRLCLEALTGFDVVLFLNRYDDGDDLHRRNLAWLNAHLEVPVVTTIHALVRCV
jgi:dethiobiotin synthetase